MDSQEPARVDPSSRRDPTPEGPAETQGSLQAPPLDPDPCAGPLLEEVTPALEEEPLAPEEGGPALGEEPFAPEEGEPAPGRDLGQGAVDEEGAGDGEESLDEGEPAARPVAPRPSLRYLKSLGVFEQGEAGVVLCPSCGRTLEGEAGLCEDCGQEGVLVEDAPLDEGGVWERVELPPRPRSAPGPYRAPLLAVLLLAAAWAWTSVGGATLPWFGGAERRASWMEAQQGIFVLGEVSPGAERVLGAGVGQRVSLMVEEEELVGWFPGPKEHPLRLSLVPLSRVRWRGRLLATEAGGEALDVVGEVSEDGQSIQLRFGAEGMSLGRLDEGEEAGDFGQEVDPALAPSP